MQMLVLVLGIISLSGPGEMQNLNLFKSYTAAQEALAADNYMGSKKALENLAMLCDGPMQKLVQKAASARDLASMRKAFRRISHLFKDQEIPSGYVVVFCAMAFENEGGFWIQEEGEIHNPYYGAQMLHCGSVMRKNKG